MVKKPAFKVRTENRGGRLSDYWPLIALIGITAAGAFAINWRTGDGLMGWMHYFMGLFLLSFAMLKIFNLSAFADGFKKYDLMAKHARRYGYIYPFIELALGLGYLSFASPELVYGATVLVMLFSTVGVIIALRRGLDINCPCMGSVLEVPLSTVTLTEDLGMGAMAAVMLWFLL